MRRCYLVLSLIACLAGCGKSTSTKTTQATKANDDPWQKALAAFRRETDAESCRRTLNDLNADLTKVPAAPQPKELDSDELGNLNRDVHFFEAEAKEIRPSAFTPLDAAYLAEVFYLRDVAIALDVAALPTAKRAHAAFQWVMRQVVLNPVALPPLSPSYILRRGSGSGLERAYVFVELCRQMGLDAYFIGPPEANTRPAYIPGKENPGPFWAVGVRTGNQIHLFDPWSGEALPFNLEQLRVQAPEFADRFAEWAKARGAEMEDFRKAEMCISVPISAFATRLKLLEDKLEAERGVKLTVDRSELKKNAEKASKGAPVRFWQGGGGQHSLTRTLAYTLSESEGGFAPNHSSGKSALMLQYFFSLIPVQQLIPAVGELDFQEPKDRIRDALRQRFALSFLKPPMPRELFQRGQYTEATKHLVSVWEDYTKMIERSRSEPDRQKTIAEWIKRANHLYTQLNSATNDAERGLAQQEVNQFWKSNVRGMDLLAEQGLGPTGAGEAIFLLALCKHELAERLSGPDANDPAKLTEEAREAWLVAYDWWKRYGELPAEKKAIYPGREAHAKKLTDRAGKMAKILP